MWYEAWFNIDWADVQQCRAYLPFCYSMSATELCWLAMVLVCTGTMPRLAYVHSTSLCYIVQRSAVDFSGNENKFSGV